MFRPQCHPILIGSLPLEDHIEATNLILEHTPAIPLWPQLPKLPREGMVRQFLTGFPGLRDEGGRHWIDGASVGFPDEMTRFYEDFLRAEDDMAFFRTSRFGLDDETARGFSTLIASLAATHSPTVTVKGQVTGPITTGIGIRDQDNRSIFYDDNLRDMLIKLLAQKGRWQAVELRRFTTDVPPIIFIDEPGLGSFGSSAFTGIGKAMVAETVGEVIAGIHHGGGLAGVHICANGDWEPALNSAADIISFDAFSYFDNFILYHQQLTAFLQRGGILAWGIVPTSDPTVVAEVCSDSLYGKWREQLQTLSSFGFTQSQLMAQTLIAPACGTGSLSPELARKVLEMTAEVASRARHSIMGFED